MHMYNVCFTTRISVTYFIWSNSDAWLKYKISLCFHHNFHYTWKILHTYIIQSVTLNRLLSTLPVKETKHKYLHGKTTAYRVKLKPLRETINGGCDIHMQKKTVFLKLTSILQQCLVLWIYFCKGHVFFFYMIVERHSEFLCVQWANRRKALHMGLPLQLSGFAFLWR